MSPWSSRTPIRTSPSAASPITCPVRSPTGATWPTGPSLTWKPPGCGCGWTPPRGASTFPAASSSPPPPGAVRNCSATTSSSSAPARSRSGADDELVVAEQFLTAPGGGGDELAAGNVDAPRGGVQPQPHPGGFQVSEGPVGQVAPVGDLTGQVIGDAADGEVRIGVRDDHGDIRARVEFARPQGGADPGVAAADHDQVHGRLLSGCLIKGAGRDRAAGPRTAMRRHALPGQVRARYRRDGGR